MRGRPRLVNVAVILLFSLLFLMIGFGGIAGGTGMWPLTRGTLHVVDCAVPVGNGLSHRPCSGYTVEQMRAYEQARAAAAEAGNDDQLVTAQDPAGVWMADEEAREQVQVTWLPYVGWIEQSREFVGWGVFFFIAGAALTWYALSGLRRPYAVSS